MSTQITATGGERPPQQNLSTTGNPAKRGNGGGLFALYKPGQGYWTRLGTAIGAAAIILFIGWFVFTETSVFTQLSASSRRYAVAAGVVAVLSLVAWWLMNGPRRAQFIIDTDSEMKKVNWGTWADLVGSTRVCVFFMLLTALTLFIFDTQFHAFFYSLGVWHIPFAAGAGAATGFILSLVLIAVGAALVRGVGEGKSHKVAGVISLIIGLASLIAWILFTIRVNQAPTA